MKRLEALNEEAGMTKGEVINLVLNYRTSTPNAVSLGGLTNPYSCIYSLSSTKALSRMRLLAHWAMRAMRMRD